MRALVIGTTLVLLTACGGGSPTRPAPPTPDPITLTGHLRATNGQQAIAGATVRASSGETVTSDAAGIFRFSVLPTSALRLTIQGPLVQRELSVNAGISRDVDLEGFVENGSFDLAYFRQIARGALDNAALQPIRRWTQAPQVYLRTIDEAGTPIDTATLDMVTASVVAVAPALTGGMFSVTAVERGTETRVNVPGWITIKWLPEMTDYCGRAEVGVSGGSIELYYRSLGCRCYPLQTSPRVVKHEFGHAMGFWHGGTIGDLMSNRTMECNPDVSARERQYARYLYSRPVGNTDPDTDPSTTVLLRPVLIQ